MLYVNYTINQARQCKIQRKIFSPKQYFNTKAFGTLAPLYTERQHLKKQWTWTMYSGISILRYGKGEQNHIINRDIVVNELPIYK